MPVSETSPRRTAAGAIKGTIVASAELPDIAGRVSRVDLKGCSRLAVLASSSGRGSFKEQAAEVLAALQAAVETQPVPMRVTSQTVFLRDSQDEPAFRELMHAAFGEVVTTFVYQAPCCGAAVSLEAWAIGGPEVKVDLLGRHAVAWTHDGARWVHCGDICAPDHPEGVYAQAGIAMQRMRRALLEAKTDFENAVRTWFYLGDITSPEGEIQRYMELNRARTDFYQNIRFHGKRLYPGAQRGIYPASTGIGMDGRFLCAGCLTVQTDRKDMRLLALENPRQTPAYAYHARYSPQSPKFSRAMAFVLGDTITTWISGTASIVNSESRHFGDPERQTEQTIDNIERLISAENFKSHGVVNGGAKLSDLAKVRVYIKRPEYFSAVQSVCRKRFGQVPVLYAVADVCRPELLVEIEGVAFSMIG